MSEKPASVKQRIVALCIDYFVILAYIIILLVCNVGLIYFFLDVIPDFSWVEAELVGFFSLILPVLVYLILTEYGGSGATIGKRKMKIFVVASGTGSLTIIQVMIRNCVKLFPWQLAHTAVFSGKYNDWQVAPFMMIAMIVAYSLPILSVIFLCFRKDHRTVHDLIAHTKVLTKP